MKRKPTLTKKERAKAHRIEIDRRLAAMPASKRDTAVKAITPTPPALKVTEEGKVIGVWNRLERRLADVKVRRMGAEFRTGRWARTLGIAIRAFVRARA